MLVLTAAAPEANPKPGVLETVCFLYNLVLYHICAFTNFTFNQVMSVLSGSFDEVSISETMQ